MNFIALILSQYFDMLYEMVEPNFILKDKEEEMKPKNPNSSRQIGQIPLKRLFADPLL
jgi:hypothetical protein